MKTQYFCEYSHSLNRDMEYKVYGHGGKPVIFIPCQDGRFFDFEDFDMATYWSPWIDSGRVTVYSIDTIDKETWSNAYGDARWRSERFEQWIQYITQELVPMIQTRTKEINGPAADCKILVTGCSLGATHAANLYFRFPDIFDEVLALSGIYTAEYGFGTYMDDLVYNNSPVHYLANMPTDHPFIQKYKNNKAILCVGLGPWEMPDSQRRLQDICMSKDIPVWFDYWGTDCSHDWPWWYKQVTYFLPYLLDNK